MNNVIQFQNKEDKEIARKIKELKEILNIISEVEGNRVMDVVYMDNAGFTKPGRRMFKDLGTEIYLPVMKETGARVASLPASPTLSSPHRKFKYYRTVNDVLIYKEVE